MDARCSRINKLAHEVRRLLALERRDLGSAAGGEDERAPVEHTELMERRLKAAGVPVETLYKKTEGHGFYKPENQQEYYTRLLAFFSKHLG